MNGAIGRGKPRLARAVRFAAVALAMVTAAGLSACSNIGFGPDIGTRTIGVPGEGSLPVTGETLGTGPVKVALLLPLSGEVTSVGTAMANGARLAMDFVASSPNISDNITLIVKDTASNRATASAMASAAVNEGASLILGPLKADSVQAAGAVARAAGVPMIAFSNNSGAAAPGVYLLNVLPETEVRRTLSYAKSLGRSSFAAVVPTTEFGRIQEGAFRQAAADLGLTTRAIYSFANETEARTVISQLTPQLQAGSIDALFIPDRATASSFGVLLENAGIDKNKLTLIGSADWEGDAQIAATTFLSGAIYPAVDDTGQKALRPDYVAKFGIEPHALTSIAYTATLLANSSTLSQSTPRYAASQITRSTGFNGRDGLFRFLPDGRSEYALVIKQVVPGGAQVADGPKLP